MTGVTGARSHGPRNSGSLVNRVKLYSSLPAAVGFGVSRPEHVRAVARSRADGVIVGSALVDALGPAGRDVDAMARLVGTLAWCHGPLIDQLRLLVLAMIVVACSPSTAETSQPSPAAVRATIASPAASAPTSPNSPELERAKRSAGRRGPRNDRQRPEHPDRAGDVLQGIPIACSSSNRPARIHILRGDERQSDTVPRPWRSPRAARHRIRRTRPPRPRVPPRVRQQRPALRLLLDAGRRRRRTTRGPHQPVERVHRRPGCGRGRSRLGARDPRLRPTTAQPQRRRARLRTGRVPLPRNRGRRRARRRRSRATRPRATPRTRRSSTARSSGSTSMAMGTRRTPSPQTTRSWPVAACPRSTPMASATHGGCPGSPLGRTSPPRVRRRVRSLRRGRCRPQWRELRLAGS